ncbi:MAG: exosortase A [Burkholderiales bacterium]|nr:exosortase A [Burkholderiales bacterium]
MNAIVIPATTDARWRVALASLALLIAALLWMFRGTALGMVDIWWNFETYTHAFLVAPISVWLVWRQRADLVPLTPRPQPWLLLALAVVGAIWLAGDLALVNVVSQFAFVGLIVLSVAAVLGVEIAWAIAFPLAFLFFAVPFGEFAIPWMMRWTADFTVYALQASGIPVYREGQSFVIPSGRWSVVAACSGVRYLIASFMVGTLFAYLNYKSIKRRLIFMVVALIVPIVANWLRAYMIVMLGHLSNNTIAVGVDHLVYGWVFFGIVITIMFFVGARWAEPPKPLPPAAPALVRSGVPQSTWGSVGVALAAALVLALPMALAAHVHDANRSGFAPELKLPNVLADGWRADAAAGEPFVPSFLKPAAEAGVIYRSTRGVVGVYIAYYRDQSPTSKFVGGDNWITRPADLTWNTLENRVTPLSAEGRTLDSQGVMLLERDESAGALRKHREVRRLHWTAGHWYAEDSEAKLANLLAQIRGQGDDGAELLLYTDDSDPAAADRLLQSFAAANLGAIDRMLLATQARR